MKRIATIFLILSILMFSVISGLWTGLLFVQAANYSELYQIKFNPTGTHIKDGQLKIELDFIPTEAAQTYNEQHIYTVNTSSAEYLAGYTGKVDKDGNPLSSQDYQNWWDSLPHTWVTNPALRLFVAIDNKTTVDDIYDFLNTKYTASTLATIDYSLTQENSLHLISPFLKDKTIISTAKVTASPELIDATNTRFFQFTVSGNGLAFSPETVKPQSIDVGLAAIDRTSSDLITGYVYFPLDNPANASGTIDTVEAWFASGDPDEITYGTVYLVSGVNYSSRDTEYVGALASGSKQTSSGLSISIESGDFIGVNQNSASGAVYFEADGSGYSGTRYLNTDFPFTNQSTSLWATEGISLYATGSETPGGDTAPTVVTANATSITYTQVTGQGNITATGGANATSRGFQYGIGAFTANVSESGNYGTGNFSIAIPSLTAGTEYQYRAYAINSGGIGYGATVNFTTTAYTMPILVTANATSVSYTSATGQGNITSVDGDNATTRGFQYGISGFTDNVSESGNYGTGNFSLAISGLTANTEYQYRAYAINGGGIGYGASVNFTTTAYTVPVLVTFNATSVSYTTATGQGNITSVDGANATTRGFQYGIGSFTDNVSESGNYGTGNYSLGLTSLTANTEYMIRAYAVNAGGIGYGASVNFTTLAITAPTVTTQAATSISATSATLNGNITDIGGQNCAYRGFQWSTSTGNYSANYTASGSFGTGAFTYGFTGTANTTYYTRAFCQNDAGIAYGTEVSFTLTAATTATTTTTTTTTSTDYTQEYAYSMAMLLCLVIGFYRRDGIIFIFAGGLSIICGFYWGITYRTNIGFTIGVMLIIFSFYCFFKAIRYILIKKQDLKNGN